MINLMYLVLTAMLALNVSAEVINAFFKIDDSNIETYSQLTNSNSKTMKAFNASVEERPDSKVLYQTAGEIQREIAAFNSYIDGLRDSVTALAGGVYPEDDEKYAGRPKKFKDKEIPQMFFVQGNEGTVGDAFPPKGPELQSRIEQTRSRIIQIVRDMVDANKNNEDFTITEDDLLALENDISLRVDSLWRGSDKESWAAYTFGYMPVAATYPLLSKFKNDALASEAAIINFLANKVGSLVLEFDEFEVVNSAEKGYVIKGDPYKADIFLSAFSSQADISVSVNGQRLPVRDGKATYSARPSSIGEKSYNAKITVRNPLNNKTETYTKTFKYEVGERSVAVSADKMNVFYIGVPNPISVSAAGIPSNSLRVSATGGANLQKTGSNSYTVNVSRPGEVKINVSGEGLSASKDFRVKRIPDPVARLGRGNNTMGNGEFRAQEGIIAVLENFDFDARCNIQGFTMTRQAKRVDPVSTPNSGGRFTGRAEALKNQAAPGDTYYFDDIKARCPGDSAGRKINDIVIKIR